MSKIIHGTSLSKALKIIEDPSLNEFNQDRLYFFESKRKESYAGALAFSTGDGLRSVNNSFSLNFINDYIELNDSFPKGMLGKILKFLLKKSIKKWKEKQEFLNRDEYDNISAIIECENIVDLISVSRKDIIFESYVNKENFNKIKVLTIYVDQLHREEVKLLLSKNKSNVEVKSIEDLIEITRQEKAQSRDLFFIKR